MKLMRSVITAMLLLLSHTCFGQEPAGTIEGLYKGKIEYFFKCKTEVRLYDITLFNMNADYRTISVKNYDYEKLSEFTMKKCAITGKEDDLLIACKGNWGSADYILSRDSLKGKGVYNTGKEIMTFTVKVRKTQEKVVESNK